MNANLKLTAVSIYHRGRRRVHFIKLRYINGRAVMSKEMHEKITRHIGRGETYSLGA
jgi:hypothetical protein